MRVSNYANAGELAGQLQRALPPCGGPVTQLVDDKTCRVGAFVDGILLSRSADLGMKSTHPIQVPGEHLLPGDHGVIGSALDQWLQLTQTAKPDIRAVVTGMKMARREKPGFDLLNMVDDLSHSSVMLLSAAVVLGWFDAIYHSAGMALVSSPVGGPGLNTGEDLLNLVPDRYIEDLNSLTAAACRSLGPILSAEDARFQIRLEAGGIFGDVDIVANHTLLDLKTNLGSKEPGGRRFVASRSMFRQLLGYVLLDVSDSLNLHSVGIYAARYDELWSARVDRLLSIEQSTRSISEAREAFAWLVAAI